jgi:hypothetical protein
MGAGTCGRRGGLVAGLLAAVIVMVPGGASAVSAAPPKAGSGSPPLAPDTSAQAASTQAAPLAATSFEVTIPGSGEFGDLLVDATTQHVFVTRGDVVAVYDLEGAPVTSVGGQSGAGAMSLVDGNLYVLQKATGRIRRVDPVTLVDHGTIGSAIVGAREMVASNGQLYVAAGQCGSGPNRLYRVDPTSGSSTELSMSTSQHSCPELHASPEPDVVNTRDVWASPSRVERWDVTGAAVVVAAVGQPPVAQSISAIGMADDGSVLYSGIDGQAIVERDPVTLAPTGGTISLGGDLVHAIEATSAHGGLIAVAMRGIHEDDLRLFSASTSHEELARVDLGGNWNLVPPGGVAFAPSGDLVFAVSLGGAAGPPVLNVVFPFGIPTGGFHPLAPVRILDTRAAGSHALGQGEARSLQVTGRGGVPVSGVTSVVVNVTVDAPSTPGYLSLSPSGEPLPRVSNLNFVAGQTVPNLVTVPVGDDGKVRIFNSSGSTQVIVDVAGWYDDTGDGAAYHPVEPQRILDTRFGVGGSGPVQAGQPLTLQVRGRAGVPAGATAVAMNVTETRPTTASHLTIWPSGLAQPVVSNLNFRGGMTRPNMVIVPIGADGSVKIANAAGGVHVIADVAGWYGPGDGGSRFVPVTPTRLLDTRDFAAPLWPGETIDLPIGDALPVGATAVVLNVTNVNSTASGFLTVHPTRTTPRPVVSNLNFLPGEVNPNLVVVPLGDDGSVSFYNDTGDSDVVIDIFGFYTP